MKLTPEQFAKALPHTRPSDRLRFLAPLNAALERWGIAEPLEVAHFLAQVAHESGSLRYTEELASGKAYEGRADLGNIEPGDGVRFKGRGLIQLTGRANYRAYVKCRYELVIGEFVDFERSPEKLTEPQWATDSACWYWRTHKRKGKTCGDYALADDLEGVTRCVNGGLNGLADRRLRLLEARKALGV